MVLDGGVAPLGSQGDEPEHLLIEAAVAGIDGDDPAIAAAAGVVLHGELDQGLEDLDELANLQPRIGEADRLGGAEAGLAELGDLGSVDGLHGEPELFGVGDKSERGANAVAVEGDESNGSGEGMERGKAERLIAGGLVAAGTVVGGHKLVGLLELVSLGGNLDADESRV